MSQENFSLFDELNKLKVSGITDMEVVIPAVKTILMKDQESRGLETLRNAPFSMVKIILDNQSSKFDVELKCIEAQEEIKHFKDTYLSGKYDNSVASTFLIVYYNAVKPVIGERFFVIMKDVFEDSYETIISEMEKEIVVLMADVFREFPSWSTAEKHTQDFCEHYKEKYANSHFEKIVYDFVDDYVVNGKPIPMKMNSTEI
jgi:glutathionyl-hydroquinone reductase